MLVGYQLDRSMAHMHPELNDGRSNGCAYADSPGHIPIQRMANVSLQPAPDGPSTDGADRPASSAGIYVVGDKSWSIDMQRYNFQFTGQRFYRIEDGELAGQLRDVAYQATTTDFWGSMEARRRPGHLGARRRVQLRQGPARPGRRRSPTAAPRRCSATSTSSTPPPRPATDRRCTATDRRHEDPHDGTSPQELVEHALRDLASDECVVIVHDSTSANLRWANNTLTTNGVMHGVAVTVVAFHGGAARARRPAR